MRAKLILVTAALLAFISAAPADIYQWEYIDPGHPELGVRQSTTLCPGGSGVSAGPGVDFGTRDLTQAYLFQANLSGASFTDYYSGANLTNANLSQADLSNANLGRVTLTNADFTDAIVNGAYIDSAFTAAQLYSTTSYKNGNLTNIVFNGWNNNDGYYQFSDGNFAGKNLSYANFTFATMDNANFSHANLSGVWFYAVSMGNANFTDAVITGGAFKVCNLTEHQFYSTASYKDGDLSSITLSGNKDGWNFAGKNLTYAQFEDAMLRNTNFRNANLSGAVLRNSDLTNTNLIQSNLNGAYFWDSSLNGTDTRGSTGLDLSGILSGMLSYSFQNLIDPNGKIAGLILPTHAAYPLGNTNPQLIVRNYNGATPIPIRVQSGMTMSTGVLTMELDANAWGSTISFDPGIPVSLSGTLQLTFAAGVDANALGGRSFRLFDWTGVTPTGTFDTIDTGGYNWDVSQLYTIGSVTLVPEPATLSLLALGGLAMLKRRRKTVG